MGTTTNAALKDAVGEVTIDRLEEAIRTTRQVSAKAVGWLTDRVVRGVPAHSQEFNSWWRVPWALTLSGERDVAAGILAWAEKEALTEDGDLRAGPYGGGQERAPVYQLAHLALAAHLLDRYDLSARLFRGMLRFWNADDGGTYAYRDRRGGQMDWLMTSQVGLVAIALGEASVRDQTFGWFQQMWRWQPDLPQLRLVTGRDARGLDAGSGGELPLKMKVVDFTQPQEHFFQPGAAAAFLAEHAAQTGNAEAVEIARGLLSLNVEGTLAQLTDTSSVHACKFPWGAAELCALDQRFDWAPYLVLFADWFRDRQEESGAWSPSAFTLSGPATDVDRMWKTAEHLMEVQKIAASLASRVAVESSVAGEAASVGSR
jgi:hypothetical protein